MKIKKDSGITKWVIITLLVLGVVLLLLFVFGNRQSTDDYIPTADESQPTSQVGSPGAGFISSPSTDEIVNILWMWSSFTDPVQSYDIDSPDKYTVYFETDGNISIVADCNSARTTYELNNGQFSIGPIATTLQECGDNSRSDDFLLSLSKAKIYFMKDGNLYLDLEADGGTMEFTH